MRSLLFALMVLLALFAFNCASIWALNTLLSLHLEYINAWNHIALLWMLFATGISH